MIGKKFNLIDEPWILVLDDGGEVQKISIVQLFEKAHKLKSLVGELPIQDIALLRMLLAIMYAVFTEVDVQGRKIELDDEKAASRQWHSLWNRKAFPIEPIKEYLEDYRDRFYLIHPETPFYQVKGLHTANGETNSITQIIADVPSRVERRFFSNRSGSFATTLSFDEAARWLVSLQNWDYAGKKASVVGGAPNGGGTGWLGKLGIVYLEGKSLFETLLLNFVLIDDSGLITFGEPTWHNPFTKPAKRERPPDGYVELLTWQSRRVLLFEEDGLITGVLSSYGDVFEKDNTFIEKMSGWHLSKAGRGNSPAFIPNTFSKERLLWRDFTSLLPAKASREDNRAPGTVAWRKYLKRRGLIEDTTVQIATIGIEYGSMQGVVNELIADRLSFSSGFLSDMGDEWAPRLNGALDKTEKCINILGTLARDLERAAGADDQSVSLKAASAHAREMAYGTLDTPFRRWLVEVDPEKEDPDEMCIKWMEFARNTVFRIGEDLVARCSAKTIAGRGGGKDAPSAFLRFQGRLYKEVPLQRKEGVDNDR